MDLTCRDDKCIICGSLLENKIVLTFRTKQCKNNCIHFILDRKTSKIFSYVIFNSKSTKDISEIKQQILYWKENDRYLTKILE